MPDAHTDDGCVFCNPYLLPETTLHSTDEGTVMEFVPLNPVTPGHVLVVPVEHVDDATIDPMLTGAVMEVASRLAAEHDAANIITSIGRDATQSVRHLHLHVVPRRPGDGLPLPWTPQQEAAR